jgi:hypothetical protein
MKFKILLYILGRKLIKKALTNADFKKKISEKKCTVLIKTADNKKGRYFTFANGSVASTSGIAANPTVSLVWKDAAIGFSTLASSDESKSMKALENGDLQLEGDIETALWFTDVAKMVR